MWALGARFGETDLLNRILGCLLGHARGRAVAVQTAPHPDDAGDGASGRFVEYPSLVLGCLYLDLIEQRQARPTTADLAAVWREHVRCCLDEYGAARNNLDVGLEPPVTGWFDNPYSECAAALDRATVWGCVAPASPASAAALAHDDAVIDHGGEGVYAAMALAAAISAAFAEPSAMAALAIGRGMVQEASRTAHCLETVLQARRGGIPYEECRDQIGNDYGRGNPTDAVAGLAYAAVGLLYGSDWRSRIEHAACGPAAHIPAAAAGALAGALEGAEALALAWPQDSQPVQGPDRYVTGASPPATYAELARRSLSAAMVLAAAYPERVRIADGDTDLTELDAIELADPAEALAALETDPREVLLPPSRPAIRLSYEGTPTIASGGTKTLRISTLTEDDSPPRVRVIAREPLAVGPERPQPSSPGAYVLVSARGREAPPVTVLRAVLGEGSGEASAEFPLLAEHCWWVCGPFDGGTPSELRIPREPERVLSEAATYSGRDGTRVRFEKRSFAESRMDLEPMLRGRPGVLYLVTDWRAERPVAASLMVSSTGGVKAWLNGRVILRKEDEEYPLSLHKWARASLRLGGGWHRLMLKVVRYDVPLEVVCCIRNRDGSRPAGLTNVVWHPLGG